MSYGRYAFGRRSLGTGAATATPAASLTGGFIPRPSRLTQQPQYAAQIDWGHPLLQKAEIVITADRVYVSPFFGATATVTGTLLKSVTIPGIGATFNYLNYVDIPTVADASDWTIAGIFTATSTADNFIAGTVASGGRGTQDRTLEIASGLWSSYIYDGAIRRVSSGITVVSGRSDIVISEVINSTTLISRANNTEASLVVGNSGYAEISPLFSIGAASAQTPPNIVATLVIKLRRGWSKSERDSFVANPWQIFRAPQRKLWLAASNSNLNTIALGSGNSSSISTASAVGSSLAILSSNGTAFGSSSASGISSVIASSSYSGVGTSTLLALSNSNYSTTATATSLSTANSTGSSLFNSIGTSSGSSNVIGSGSSSVIGVGASSGSSSVIGVSSLLVSSNGIVSGSSSVTGVGSSSVTGVGASSANSNVIGLSNSLVSRNATSSGSSSVTGVGASTVTGSAIATSSGSSSITGFGASSWSSVGASAGSSTVTGVGSSSVTGVGSSIGSSTVTGVGSSRVSSTATSSGSSFVTGVSSLLVSSNGTVIAGSTALAISSVNNFLTGVGNSISSSVINAFGSSLSSSIGTSNTISYTSFIGSSINVSVGVSTSTSNTLIVSSLGVSVINLTILSSLQTSTFASYLITQNQKLNVSSTINAISFTNQLIFVTQTLTLFYCYQYNMSSSVTISQVNNLNVDQNISYAFSSISTLINNNNNIITNDEANKIADEMWKHSFTKKIMTISKYIGLK